MDLKQFVTETLVQISEGIVDAQSQLKESGRFNGWDGLHARININCFSNDPSIKSSLKFLRKTQWARDKVESLYVNTFFLGL